jgi:transcriptional regulator of acetoin/glycerol metabolism
MPDDTRTGPKTDAPGARKPAPPASVRQAFERFRSGAPVAPGVVEQVIEHSWRRCVGFGLEESRKRGFDPLPAPRLDQAREQNRKLALQALPVMENLYQQIVDTESMIVLTDPNGLILHSIGDDGFLQRAERVALRPGVSWSEQDRGTNAIGTAIVTGVPTLVHGAEHFLAANHFLTCSAVPIADPFGRPIGVLDVTGDWRGYHRHTMALVRMSAGVIENHLFDGAFPDDVTLHFHARAELIGTLFQGIAVFRADGTFVTANRSALFQLGQDLPALRGRRFAELFGVPLPAVLNQLAVRLDRPVGLGLPSGVRVMARVGLGKALTQASAWMGTPQGEPGAAAGRAVSSRRPRAAAAAEPALSLAALDTGDPQMTQAIARVRRVLGRDIPILIQGETGTGKELLARAIHAASPRADGPFVAVNCASIPEGLIESELFGYEEGAFTGARKRGHEGKIQLAHGGTLFLDEIGDMPAALQARLLRVLQERVVTPLGSMRAEPVDLALVCATHRRLKEAIAAGSFREDLYYRINGLTVTLPPLRARSDLQDLVDRLVASLGDDGAGVQVSAEVLDLFRRHRWPGNLRQLASVLRTSLAMLSDAERILRREHLADDFLEEIQASPPDPRDGAMPSPSTAGAAAPAVAPLRELEASAIERALAAHGGNVSAAARSLGVSRNTIYRKSPGRPTDR